MNVTALSRKFFFQNKSQEVELNDIPNLEPKEVMEFYAGTYPELTNGSIDYKGIINNSYEKYLFKPLIGTKG